MRFAVLFPGQGSQQVGMGAELFERHRDVLGRLADEVLGWSLEKACLEGPQEELTRTDRAQPALYALSFVLWEELSRRLDRDPSAAAGHSLGEYTALAAAGVFDFSTGLRLVGERGKAMDTATRQEPSGMAALIGSDAEAAEKLAASRREEGGRLWVANLNAPSQIVVAGGIDDVRWAEENGRRFGVRRVIRLDVAGAFHTPFMEPAVEQLTAVLAETSFAEPAFPVWANATAAPHSGSNVAAILTEQIIAPVRFAESLSGMREGGIEAMVHVGPGDVTVGMARRVGPNLEVLTVNSIESAFEVAEALS